MNKYFFIIIIFYGDCSISIHPARTFRCSIFNMADADSLHDISDVDADPSAIEADAEDDEVNGER